MEGLTLSTKEQNRLHILNGVLERHWTMKEAAPLLGVSERQGWRVLAAYRKEGARGVVHKNRGRVPPNATPETIQQQVASLAQERYEGINHTHLTELLAEREGVMLSRPTLRRILVRAGLTSPRHRRPPQHRCRRQRMPQEGMLLQLDGSHHLWLEDRGPWLTLLLAVDDATGTAPYALFQEQEDTRGYLSLLQGIGLNVGGCRWRCTPMGMPSFSHGVVHRTYPRFPGKDHPQWSRAAWENWGSPRYWPHSPEAKGRVERANGTFHQAGGGTSSGWRLHPGGGESSAGQVLPRFNQRFGVPADQAESAYRPVNPEPGWRAVHQGVAQSPAKDNTVQYHGRALQLFPSLERPSYE